MSVFFCYMWNKKMLTILRTKFYAKERKLKAQRQAKDVVITIFLLWNLCLTDVNSASHNNFDFYLWFSSLPFLYCLSRCFTFELKWTWKSYQEYNSYYWMSTLKYQWQRWQGAWDSIKLILTGPQLDWFNSLRLPPLKNEWLAS